MRRKFVSGLKALFSRTGCIIQILLFPPTACIILRDMAASDYSSCSLTEKLLATFRMKASNGVVASLHLMEVRKGKSSRTMSR